MATRAVTQGEQTTVLVVPSMHCAACMGKVEGALSALAGVTSARVNLTARQVRVVHGAKVTVPEMVLALSNVGYPAQLREGLIPRAGSDNSAAMASASA